MSYNIGDWMWIVGDTNPTTQVYSSASGGMIANNSAAFLAWLTGRAGAIAIGDHDGYSIGAAADNGSGLIRLTVTTTARMQTGQRWAVAGSGSASVDGNWPVTVIDGTHIDLQGSNFAFAGAVTGGYVLGATFIDTMANLTSVLNRAAFTRFQEATRSFTSAVDLTLDNPLAATSLISVTASGRSVTLPAMNAVNAVPVGLPFVVVNTGAFTFTLKDKSGATLGELAAQASWSLTNTSNASAAGSFQSIITLYNSGTAGILQTAPKTDTGTAAQGDFTYLAHQSNPGQFDGRNNEVWGLGYNLSAAWASRNGSDDGATLGRIETHYMPDATTGPAFEYHYACVSKVAGGEFRALSFAIQKAGSSNPSPYYTVGSISAHEFRITRPSDAQEVFGFSPQDSLSGTLGTFRLNDGYINIANVTAANATLQVWDQRKASTNLVHLYQFNSVGKWRTQVEHTTFKWVIYDEVANAAHTTFYSNGGVAVGAPTGGDKGVGKLNAQGLFVNGNELIAELYLALVNPVLNPSGQVIDKALAAVSDNNYTWTPWIALSQGGNITPSQLTDVENGTPFMMRYAQGGSNRFGAIQPIRSDLCKYYRGQQVTLSGRVRINTAHTIRYAVIEWTGTADSPTTDVVNDWTSSTFTAGNFFKSTNLTIAGTGSVTPGTNTLASISLTVTLGSSLNNLLLFFWADSAEAANLDIGRVSLTPGSSGSLLPPRPQGIEKSLLDELFQDYDVFATNSSVSVGQAYSSSQALAALVFRKKFAKTPTGSVSAGSDFACVNAAASAANACTGVAFSGTTKTNTRLDFSGSSGLAAGDCTMIQLNGAASDAKIYVDGRITPA